MSRFDVIAIGRVGIDLYPLQVGVHLEDVESFVRYLGGSPANVAVATARLGRSTALVTRTGDDAFGTFVRAALAGYGVDDRWVAGLPGHATPVVFCEAIPPDHCRIWYYREPDAADLQIRADELDLDAIAEARLVWITLTGLSREPSLGAHLAALDARPQGALSVLDLDYRAQLWESLDEARATAWRAIPRARVLVGNLEEVGLVTGTRDPDTAARMLLEQGPSLVVIKLGDRGAVAYTASEAVRVPGVAVTVVNGMGAGDGFGGAMCHGLLEGWSLERMLTYACAAGAIVASQLGCAPAMPTDAEIEALLAEVAARA